VSFGEHASLPLGHGLLLVAALAIAFGFEVVNGFHDTANAVATVIYTRSLRPWVAVVWSGLWNFIGVHAGGIAVAFSIVHLLPADILVSIHTAAGLAMVFSLLVAAMLWNLGTWYLGLPASSSHTLIGGILGVGIANSLLSGTGLGGGVDWHKAGEVALSLLISPVVGFGLAALLLVAARRLVPDPRLYRPPEGDRPPPLWIRGLLVLTCTGVSFAHGSNDGQKGMGLIMLIMIGILPAQFALNMNYGPDDLKRIHDAAARLDAGAVREHGAVKPARVEDWVPAGDRASARFETRALHPVALLDEIRQLVAGRRSFAELSADQRWALRDAIVELNRWYTLHRDALVRELDAERRRLIESLHGELTGAVEYVPQWVILTVALCLGAGTMVGWKRIVVTVGERIGKSHLTYGQGAVAELVAMGTIGLADYGGMPVSTTHVLSSGVAGTMWANRSGIQVDTVRSIALAWALTLPAALLLAGGLYIVLRLFVL